jgi:hypothetical protein
MKVKITLPSTQWEIPLVQYQEYVKIEEPTDIDLVSIFCNIDKQYVFDMPQKQLNELAIHLKSVLMASEKFIPTFKIDNIEMGFLPNLDEMSVGELADCEKYINDWETMHNAMAVLWRPITRKVKDKYEVEKYNGTAKYAEAMRYLPLGAVNATMVFFSTLTNDLLNSILKSIKGEEHQAQLQQILVKNGIGMQTFTQSLGEITSKLTEQRKKMYIKP